MDIGGQAGYNGDIAEGIYGKRKTASKDYTVQRPNLVEEGHLDLLRIIVVALGVTADFCVPPNPIYSLYEVSVVSSLSSIVHI